MILALLVLAAGIDVPELLQKYKVPGASVAVVSNGKVEWARGYGVAAEGGPAVTVDTLFQAASISKPVAAMAAMRLVEKGKLALDEDVNLKLRSWKVPGSETVTLRRLLSHTAGLTVHGFRGYAPGEPVPTLRQILDGASPANSGAIRVDIPPGSKHRYSGGGYTVLQQLIEDVTGKPFPEAARELVLAPLGMKNSTYEQPLPARLRGRAALAGRCHTHPEMAAAGLWTTPSDLARVILEMQRPGRVLKPATVKLMLTPVMGDYGLGFGLRNGSFGHGGANVGFRCMLTGRRDGRGAVIMTNGDSGGAVAREFLKSIALE
jgi:CubicO group peptidase (beta-lactamase class C family)